MFRVPNQGWFERVPYRQGTCGVFDSLSFSTQNLSLFVGKWEGFRLGVWGLCPESPIPLN